jgi:UDP-N-acetylmuramate: L-alanyl-gamma-D-glutamyl-meso-diaminopimelate ligase
MSICHHLIDRRPKFHLYQPNIALISGIAWDHINVFLHMRIMWNSLRFLSKNYRGGILVYNEDDAEKVYLKLQQTNLD